MPAPLYRGGVQVMPSCALDFAQLSSGKPCIDPPQVFFPIFASVRHVVMLTIFRKPTEEIQHLSDRKDAVARSGVPPELDLGFRNDFDW